MSGKGSWRRRFRIRKEGRYWNTYDEQGRQVERHSGFSGFRVLEAHLRYMHPMCMIGREHNPAQAVQDPDA